jgi:hypothetical protein
MQLAESRVLSTEPNSIRLETDLPAFELGITCQSLLDLAVFGVGRGNW